MLLCSRDPGRRISDPTLRLPQIYLYLYLEYAICGSCPHFHQVEQVVIVM